MLDAKSLDTLFRQARTQNALSGNVSDAQLRELYDLLKMGPTTMNTQPARFVFVRTKEGKEKLRPALSPGNLDKTMAAPVTVIVAYDTRFYEFLPRTFPNNPNAKGVFEGKDETNKVVCLRNGSLQGAYLIIAARALGIDTGSTGYTLCGKVERGFFPRRALEVELPVQPRHGRSGQGVSAQSAAYFRGGLSPRLTGVAPFSSNS